MTAAARPTHHGAGVQVDVAEHGRHPLVGGLYMLGGTGDPIPGVAGAGADRAGAQHVAKRRSVATQPLGHLKPRMYDKLAANVQTGPVIVDETDWTKTETAAIIALRELWNLMTPRLEVKRRKRKIKLGRRLAAQAWTDGDTTSRSNEPRW